MQVNVTTSVRLPPELLEELRAAAWTARLSLNSWMLAAFREKLERSGTIATRPSEFSSLTDD